MDSNNFTETIDGNFDIKKEFFKYVFYWKYFLYNIKDAYNNNTNNLFK